LRSSKRSIVVSTHHTAVTKGKTTVVSSELLFYYVLFLRWASYDLVGGLVFQ